MAAEVSSRRATCSNFMRKFGADTLRLLLSSKVNILLLAIPVAVTSVCAPWSQSAILICCTVALIPLCALVGELTEEMAKLSNSDSFGGFLNATFGNVAELIICIVALKDNMHHVLRLSLLGSILSNMLVVLGSSLMIGGLHFCSSPKPERVGAEKATPHRPKEMQVNGKIATTNAGLLTLAVMGLLFPSVLRMAQQDSDIDSINLSHFTAVGLLIAYAAYLVFQLGTHRDWYANSPEAEGEPDETANYTTSFVVFYMAVTISVVAVLSGWLVGSIEMAADQLNVPKAFIAAIIIPIIGNASEHVAALSAAANGKMETTFAITIGSATQISLFVMPLMVIISWVTPWTDAVHDLTMEFGPYEATVLFISVLLVNFQCLAGTTHWLAGFMMLVAYCLVGAGFWVLHEGDNVADTSFAVLHFLTGHSELTTTSITAEPHTRAAFSHLVHHALQP